MQHRAGLTATKATSAAAKATINAALRAQPGPLTRLADRDATTEAVLRAMPNHTTLHFSCHGIAYLNRPLDSYLALAEHAQLTLQTRPTKADCGAPGCASCPPATPVSPGQPLSLIHI